jgi:glycosyltransferase involved in cell wall biosynthesis
LALRFRFCSPKRAEVTFSGGIKVLCSAYIGTDFQDGVDVDVIADVHTLSDTLGVDMQAKLSEMGFRVLRPGASEDNYPLFMLWFGRHVRWDIGLAPLRATAFSEAKSDIKFLDYSAVGAATGCSDVPAYGTVRHGETGLCVENTVSAWESALEQLITQPALRERLTVNAWHYLLKERTVASAASKWLDALEDLIC